MTSLLDENLTYLKENQLSIYSEVIAYMRDSAHSPSYKLSTKDPINIECTMDKESFFLYSKFDPQYECERWLESTGLDLNVNTDFVVYGLGLTYHLTHIITKFPQVKLFICEPEVGVFIEALKVVNIQDLFSHKNIVKISVGMSKSMLNSYTNSLYYYAKFPIRVLDIPIYRSINSELFLAFLKLLEKITINKIFRKGFYELFGDQMFKNSLRNMIHMYKTPSIDVIKEKFNGSTAIVVGGGPSLQYDIDYLKKQKENCLIIAAGSSVQSLVYMGLEPHLIVSMDPGINNSYVFTRNNLNDIPLLYMPQIHHQIVETHSKYNLFAYYTNDVIINKFIDINERDYTFEPTYSVTGTAIQVAVYLGASTIIFTGQDLSYPGKQMYSPGAIHLKDNIKSDVNLNLEVENVTGGSNPTTLSMKTTLANIESVIENFPEIAFINCSSKGAVIKGTDFMKINEVFESRKGVIYDFTSIKSIINNSRVDAHPDFTYVRERSIEIITALDEFIKVSTTVVKELSKLISLSNTNEIEAEKVLRNIESKWSKVINHLIFKDLVEEWMSNELNVYDQKILDVSIETNISIKANLLQETLGTFCIEMNKKLKTMKTEYTMLLQHIK